MYSTVHIQFHHTHIGELIIGTYNNALCIVDYRKRKYRTNRETIDNRVQKYFQAHLQEKTNAIISTAQQQIDDFLAKKRKDFSVPFVFAGSDFQQKVWHEIGNVHYGTTISYQQLAHRIGSPKAVRAIANAVGANALALIVPCHRIIGSNAALIGYAGGLPAKQYLLEMEKNA